MRGLGRQDGLPLAFGSGFRQAHGPVPVSAAGANCKRSTSSYGYKQNPMYTGILLFAQRMPAKSVVSTRMVR
jgi:hypothetical protein